MPSRGSFFLWPAIPVRVCGLLAPARLGEAEPGGRRAWAVGDAGVTIQQRWPAYLRPVWRNATGIRGEIENRGRPQEWALSQARARVDGGRQRPSRGRTNGAHWLTNSARTGTVWR